MSKCFPELRTEYLKASDSEAVAKQFCYDPREEIRTPWQLDSPIGGVADQVMPGLIQHYPDRALLLTTSQCAAHCRYCFRRSSPQRALMLDQEMVQAIAEYLGDSHHIKELLLSGGDPLTMSYIKLDKMLSILRDAREDLLFRYCTRLPIVDPSRITDKLADLLVRKGPAVMVLHVNHIEEITPAVVAALQKLQQRGLAIWSQTVLLKGVNDNVTSLIDLFTQIADLEIYPHYIFQLDLAPGVDHFRVDLEEGIRIVSEAIDHVGSGVIPTYAVDVPGKGGKIDLLGAKVYKKKDRYKVVSGEITFTYPLS